MNNKFKSYLFKLSLFALLIILLDFAVSDFLLKGLLKFYGFNKKPEILLIGHSHTMLGIDNVLLENKLKKKVSKYAREGANCADRLLMIRQFMETNGDSVKIVTYDVDAYFLTSEGLSANSYKIFYPFMNNKKIYDFIEANCSSKVDFTINRFVKTARFNDLNIKNSILGYLQNYRNNKFSSVDTVILKKEVANGNFRKINFDKGLQKDFEATLEYLESKNCLTVLLFIPTISILNNSDSVNYNKAIAMLNQYSKEYKKVVFLNYNPKFSNKYMLFYDPIHLNPEGQKVVTETLIADIEQLLSKRDI